jgi:hypothetical protein
VNGFNSIITSRSTPIAFAIIAAAICGVFAQTLRFQFVSYDDPAIILGNGYVTQGLSPKGLLWAFTYMDAGQPQGHQGVENLWHPLTWISHMIDVEVFGLKFPGGHHFTNVLLHFIASCFVYLLAEKLTASRFAGLIAALLFAIHPLHVESVAWVSARKDVLSGLGFFVSLYLILQGKRPVAFLVFLAAMMAKPSTVILPWVAIIMLGWRAGEKSWGWHFWRTQWLQWRWWLLASIIVSVLTVWFQSKGSHSLHMENLPLGYRLQHLPGGLLFTIWHTLFPADLTFHYRHPHQSLWLPLGSWLLLLTVSGWVFVGRRKAPALFFAYAWFMLCSLPSSGIFYVGTSYTADRYSYLSPTAGFIITASLLTGKSFTLLAPRVKGILSTLLILLLAVLAHRQCSTWKDGWTSSPMRRKCSRPTPSCSTTLARCIRWQNNMTRPSNSSIKHCK